jgi:predicted metal-dependent HD superfamily phosphohydrolase
MNADSMNRRSVTHFENACRTIGWVSPSVRAWHQRLTAAYDETGRCYHGLQHLSECLHWVDDLSLAEIPGFELVLWFHDAVYDPKSITNEEDSARLLRSACVDPCISSDTVSRLESLILVTKHHQPGTDAHAQLLVDVDLAVLGAEEGRFDEYEMQIRHEYLWVPEKEYRLKRSQILAGFLKRPRIYHTELMQERLEARARSNLSSLIKRLA